jgi:hypothetical protein
VPQAGLSGVAFVLPAAVNPAARGGNRVSSGPGRREAGLPGRLPGASSGWDSETGVSP